MQLGTVPGDYRYRMRPAQAAPAGCHACCACCAVRRSYQLLRMLCLLRAPHKRPTAKRTACCPRNHRLQCLLCLLRLLPSRATACHACRACCLRKPPPATHAVPAACRSHRRLRMAITTAVELGTQTVCIGAWVELSAWTLTQACPGEAWGRATAGVGLVMWTCLNTGGGWVWMGGCVCGGCLVSWS